MAIALQGRDMNIQTLLKNIEENNMQTLIASLEKGIVNISSEEIKNIPLKDIEEICKLNLGYKVGDEFLVTKNYIYNLVLSSIKKSPSVEIDVSGIPISPSFISNILENLVKDGLISKEDGWYIPNVKKIISKEGIESFFQHTISVFSVSDVVDHFGLKSFGKDYVGAKQYSDAAQHCKNILNELVTEGKIGVYKPGIDKYFWK